MDDMFRQHETPTGDAGAAVGHYLTGTLAAADATVRLLTWLRQRTHPTEQDLHLELDDPQLKDIEPVRLEPGDLERAAELLDAQRAARAAMLGPDEGRDADGDTALTAWFSTVPHRAEDPQVELVAGRAEARLRELHPDAMSRYDALRAGLSPVEAMREVAPLIAAEQDRHGAGEGCGPLAGTATATGENALRPGADSAAGQAPEVRYASLVRDVLSAPMAADVLRDDAWPALAGALRDAERLGAQPADLLRHVAGQRELDSAKHIAEVLHHRLDRHPVEQRTPTAADVAASSYPTPLSAAAAPAGTPPGDPFAAGFGEHLEHGRTHLAGPDPATLGAAAELGRATERHAAQASAAAADDPSTPHVDERYGGLSGIAAHTHRAAADQSTATAGITQAATHLTKAGVAAPAPQTAAQSYPMPIDDAQAAHAAPNPMTTTAPSARAAVKAHDRTTTLTA